MTPNPGKDLAKIRRARGLTACWCARTCRVTRNTWSRWERGHVTPSEEHRAQISALLGEDAVAAWK